MSKGIGIAIQGEGALTLDQLKIDTIVVDQRARMFLERRAREEGTDMAGAITDTIRQALNEWFEHNKIV